MIAVTLGLVLIAGVGSVYLGTQQTYRMQQAQSKIQESGRFAVERLGRELRQAGFFGCRKDIVPEEPRTSGLLPDGFIRNTLNPAPPASPAFDFDFGTAIVGYEATGGGWMPSLPATDLVVDPDPNSDIVIMAQVSSAGTIVTHHPGGNPPGSANIQIATDNGIMPGDILMVSDCRSAAVFQVTAGNPDESGSIPHSTGTSESPSNWTRSLGRNFVGADVFSVERVAFYVAPGSESAPGSDLDPPLSLYRNTDEIVENVEQMQIRYGEDTTGDRAIDTYNTADNVGNWRNVLAVRIALLVSSGDTLNVADEPQRLMLDGEVFDAPDLRLYQVFNTTVGLRNRLD